MQYSVVVPVYNSSKTLPVLLNELTEVMQKVGEDYELVFVDDCSKDNSWNTLKELQSNNKNIKIIRLANNVGQWMATLAGIQKTTGKHIITIDDDLEYDTNDIELLIKSYKENEVYLVYGIPIEKKNKNLSYKLFFRIRDYFLRIFFNKIQTESFKIFKREIYFNQHNEMFSHIHFEAYTKFTVSQKYIGHVNVNYRKRYFGNSNHTLFMKAKIMMKYGIEYYKSPFKYLLYPLLFLLTFYWVLNYLVVNTIILVFIKMAVSIICLLIVGILGKYLSSIYFKLKGLPEYVIIEEH
jgi:glycosyltransferase involved in cell wall biosynthesis